MQVTSRDGVVIGFDAVGDGPTLVLVDAAGHFRAFSSFDGLVDRLARDFTVIHYDRRGRGESTDTTPYAVEREIDDLAALIGRAGGPAFVHGSSSGGLLALHAAAAGVPIARMTLFEPPIAGEDDRDVQVAFTTELRRLVGAGERDAAVEHFLSGVGLPAELLAEMRTSPAWAAMASVAPTLVHDSVISERMSPQVIAAVPTPTLVLSSSTTDPGLAAMARAVAGTLPHGTHRVVEGAWHGVADDVLAPVLREHLLSA